MIGKSTVHSAARLARVLLYAFAVAAPGETPATAASAFAAATDACGVGTGEPARVLSVENELELRLSDGRRVRLAGIDPARATPLRPGLGDEARAALAARLRDREVTVAAQNPAPDRWNRTVAFVSVRAATPEGDTAGALSESEALVEAGWARAKPSAEASRCLPRLLEREERARSGRRGMWSDPFYATLDPDDRDELARHAGGMVLVEGVLSIRNDRARAILRLGGPGSAFRATLSRRAAKTFEKNGLVVEDYVGTRVRLRGVLDDRFGPAIDLRDPEQFESLEPGPGENAAEGAAPRPR